MAIDVVRENVESPPLAAHDALNCAAATPGLVRAREALDDVDSSEWPSMHLAVVP